METIRVLQKTYENLYVLSTPIVLFLEAHLPVLSPNWKNEFVDKVIDEIKEGRNTENRVNLYDLDVYYLIKILRRKEIWYPLKSLFPEEGAFFTDENRKLFKDVQQIRNDISHPSLQKYSYKDYEHNSDLKKDLCYIIKERGNDAAHGAEVDYSNRFLSDTIIKFIEIMKKADSLLGSNNIF